MVSDEDLAALEEAGPGEFERRWAQLMIAHHEGAIAMAEQEVAEGENPEAVELARRIADAQRLEITQLEALAEG